MPVWTNNQRMTIKERDRLCDNVSGHIVLITRQGSTWVAQLDSGQRITFTFNMVRLYCPHVGDEVEAKAIPKHNSMFGKYYQVTRQWRIDAPERNIVKDIQRDESTTAELSRAYRSGAIKVGRKDA